MNDRTATVRWVTVRETGDHAAAVAEVARRTRAGEFALVSSPLIEPDTGAKTYRVVCMHREGTR